MESKTHWKAYTYAKNVDVVKFQIQIENIKIIFTRNVSLAAYTLNWIELNWNLNKHRNYLSKKLKYIFWATLCGSD